jgi:TolB-like protein/tetratricopeptide (TPR) repeat protein
MPDVFLSYNREDAAVAKLFAEAFAHEGFEVWWDVTLRSGETFDEVTEAALRSTKAVVVLWSPRSVTSRWVRAEASIADDGGTLLPVKIEACDLPVMFRLTQTADLSHWQGEAGDPMWQAFLGDVRGMVGRRESAPIVGASAAKAVSSGGGEPVVAVLPIQSRGGDGTEVLAEDLTEDITRELSQSFYCKVIAASTMTAWRGRATDHRALKRELDVRYAIEGKLQSVGEYARLSVQLIDAESDNVLWTSRMACKLSDIEGSPEHFPFSIAIALDQTIAKIEITRARAKQPPCSAWEYVLRASGLLGVAAPGSANRGVEEARQAVMAAPDYGMAHSALAHTLSTRLQVDRLTVSDAERRAAVREARDAIKRAMELDGNNPAVLTRLSNTFGALGDVEAGLRLAQRAAALAPSAAEAQFALGFANFMLGRTAETIDALSKQKERIGLSDNSRWGGQSLLGICLFIEGRSAEAEEAIDESLTIQPTYYVSLRWKAIVAADLGKELSARATVRLLREAEPGKSIDDYLDSPRHLPIEHPRKYEAIAILRRLLEETEDDA